MPSQSPTEEPREVCWDCKNPRRRKLYNHVSGKPICKACLLDRKSLAEPRRLGSKASRRASERAFVSEMAHALALYALQPRDSHKTMAFFGNDARLALANFLECSVLELEPGCIDRDELRTRISERVRKLEALYE